MRVLVVLAFVGAYWWVILTARPSAQVIDPRVLARLQERRAHIVAQRARCRGEPLQVLACINAVDDE